MSKIVCVIAAACLVFPAGAAGSDKVKTGGKTVFGKVTEMSKNEITVENGADRKKFPINEVDAISYDEEPKDLTNARNQFNKGSYDDALKSLSKIDMAEVKRHEIKEDVEFYKGMCAARLALFGSRDEKDRKAAGAQLLAFIKNNTGNYHYFEACETIGDLLAAIRSPAAETYYKLLADAPWPEYRLRATVLSGRALTSQKEYVKAIAKFEEVIGQPGNERQRLSATLGKAMALAGMGKVEDAIKLLDQVIGKADPENKELHARAYNARGNCYLLAAKRPAAEVGGRSPKDNKQHALTDFLHVDLLYSGYPEQHAEALANLAVLWKEVNKAKRAADAQAELMQSYPNSSWARGTQSQP